jgi:hypothetical protein
MARSPRTASSPATAPGGEASNLMNRRQSTLERQIVLSSRPLLNWERSSGLKTMPPFQDRSSACRTTTWPR